MAHAKRDPQMVGVLYISYDGILEPLGQSQVLAYIERLCAERAVHLVSFEKADEWMNLESRRQIETRVRAAGLQWHPRRYHKRPSALATAYDIVIGTLSGLWLILRYRLGIVHARSYVPATMALLLKYAAGVRFVFDMRGFWADERVDGGLWPAGGKLYQIAKWFERRFLLNADCVVALTKAAVAAMQALPYLQGRMPRFEVITTCADLELFHPSSEFASAVSADRPLTLGYVGSVGVWYLFDDTLRFFKLLRQRIPDARLHILNRGQHRYIRERLEVVGLDPTAAVLEEADHRGVASAMRKMDAGIFFYKPGYSRLGTAPTRLAEFLGCGVPCVANTGVGDMADILNHDQVGVAIHEFSEPAMRDAIERLLQLTRALGTRTRCREVALRYFSLTHGIRAYSRIYESLADA